MSQFMRRILYHNKSNFRYTRFLLLVNNVYFVRSFVLIRKADDQIKIQNYLSYSHKHQFLT